ncbi:MAG: glycoside hydrolase family 3 C-terminal domain-containing protein [Firmicutes bacterium]|nr:glycoside hydrolase family 3 C-terminal domain-containing protein [Bacillota bacterium]
MIIDETINSLTLEEKAAFLQGWSTWTSYEKKNSGIPVCFLSDGPHGLRKQAGTGDHLGLNASIPATCFPTAATMANSWDEALGEELGRALGREAAANGVNVLLGPGLNMKRSPLCGRNFEYFSEDPYLAGKMAAAYIRGIQENGVAACPKHFAVNSQELRRMAMDSVVDERTLREIYLTGFEIAVKEGKPRSIMSSYNKVNGTYANENAHLLKEILRDDWGFDGFVVTDWGADNDHALGVKNGSNLVMPAPGPDAAIGLVNAVKEGRVSEADLDERLKELFRVLVSADEAMKKAPKSFDKDAHHALARKCAEQSIVLLENDGILPLDWNAVVGIIGDFARNPRYQGAGSSMVNPTRLDNLYDCLRAAGVSIASYAQGFDRRKPNPDQKLIDEAVRVAEAAPVVLLCVGLDEIAESEGMDRSNMELSKGQRELIEAVCKVNRNVVLVLSGGSPFVIPGSFRAAIHGYLGGQAGAGAMADALLGKVNPSGKLNETWPLQLEDTPACAYFPSKERTAEYREGLYIGYRYYDTANIPVRYPFGHGLSYTTFLYSDIHAEKDRVTFTIANAGAWDGAEVAQVYVSCRDGNVFRPQKELKGFAKVFLKAGESRTVSVSLDDKAFRYFNVKTNRWEVESGIYTISVASDAAHVRLSANIRVEGTNAPAPYGELPGYESGRITRISEVEYRDLLGHPIPDGHWGGELTRNDAICQLYYAKTGAARLVYKILTHMKEKSEAKGIPDLNILFVYNMPFRALAKMSGGLMSDRMVDDVVLLVNGHFWRGLGRLIGDFFRNRRANKAFMKKIR